MFFRDKRVLVTGGTGFVGSHFVDALLDAEAQVCVPLHTRPLHRQHPRLLGTPADLMRFDDCLRVTQNQQYVIHAAGPVAGAGLAANAALDLIRRNLTLLMQVLQACCQNGVERLLIFSSSTGYPAYEHPVQESEFWAEDLHPSYAGYGWMRRYGEKLAEFARDTSALQIAIVRPGAIYGPRDHFSGPAAHVLPELVRRAEARETPFEVWGTGEEVRDFLHVRDLVRGSLLALTQPGDPVNIASGQELRIRELVTAVLKASGYDDAEVLFNPERPTRIPVRRISIEKASRELGFQPAIALEDGLRELVVWYREHAKGRIHA
ncbi:MAG: NAD-dependent epimerase/dehydratase family protein [Candidatus Sericytochromatia bacterium]